MVDVCYSCAFVIVIYIYIVMQLFREFTQMRQDEQA